MKIQVKLFLRGQSEQCVPFQQLYLTHCQIVVVKKFNLIKSEYTSVFVNIFAKGITLMTSCLPPWKGSIF